MTTQKRSEELSSIPLMGLATSFWSFKTLAAALEFDLFTSLSERKSATVAETAAALDLEARPAEMLLTGCAALALLEKRRDRYRNTPLAEKFLVPGEPYFFGDAPRTNQPTTWDPKLQRSLFDGLDPVVLASSRA